MGLIVQALVFLIGLLHVYFLSLEMFFWTKPRGLKAFGQTLEQARASKVLAANQGLYNGFLAAGLVWGVFHPDVLFALQIKIFFLSCVFLAGIYGGLTAHRQILIYQAMPAALALILIFCQWQLSAAF